MREAKDRSSLWLIEHYGPAVLWLGGLRNVRSCRALATTLVHPKQLPDGLLEVFLVGQDQPSYVIVEIATYPERRLPQTQVVADAMLVRFDRGVLPNILTLVLRPKGQLQITGQHQEQSDLGWTTLGLTWRVENLWQLSTADLLATNEVGLIPWVPLAQHDGPPEALIQQCRQRIDQQARPEQRENLIAVTQVFTQLRYNDLSLFAILGGRQMIFESPLIQELLEERTRDIKQQDIIRFLTVRFGILPPDLIAAMKTIQEEARLNELLDWAASCPDLEAFRARVLA